MNPKKFMPRHTIIKLLKLKTKQKVLKAVRNDTLHMGEKQFQYDLISHLKPRKSDKRYLSSVERKELSIQISISNKNIVQQ